VTASWRSFFLRRCGESGWLGAENGVKSRPTLPKGDIAAE
jgi:hypothetical protein